MKTLALLLIALGSVALGQDFDGFDGFDASSFANFGHQQELSGFEGFDGLAAGGGSLGGSDFENVDFHQLGQFEGGEPNHYFKK